MQYKKRKMQRILWNRGKLRCHIMMSGRRRVSCNINDVSRVTKRRREESQVVHTNYDRFCNQIKRINASSTAVWKKSLCTTRTIYLKSHPQRYWHRVQEKRNACVRTGSPRMANLLLSYHVKGIHEKKLI